MTVYTQAKKKVRVSESKTLSHDEAARFLGRNNSVYLVGGTVSPDQVRRAVAAQLNVDVVVFLAQPQGFALRVKAVEQGRRPSDCRLFFYR